MALYALGGCVIGLIIGWLVRALITRRQMVRLTSQAMAKLDDLMGQRDQLASDNANSKAKVEKLQTACARRSSELKSALEKSKLLARNVRTLRREREKTKVKVSTVQAALVSLRRKSVALQSEFEKTRTFFKRELAKSFEKRQILEEDIKSARAEQESFAKQVESSVAEHGSEENMIVAAQLRLGQLDVLERNVSKLEAENAQLKNDAVELKRKYHSRERELRELEELRLHNQQLVRCAEALEGSRQEHEADAERYRDLADQSEKESDT
ncbi:MAG: hypothetical protein KJO09_10680, partial [Gammaproteobacteria bacterium]|nr:hypothetical protein [Gammaproteobacteria bacterium]